MNATKFVSHDIPSLESLSTSKVYKIREKLDKKERLSREEKNFITENIRSNSHFSNAIPLQGWKFDFSDVTKTFLVKQYGYWLEYNAIDKTSLRSMLNGRIDHIKEL
jgi:hypothetical protein